MFLMCNKIHFHSFTHPLNRFLKRLVKLQQEMNETFENAKLKTLPDVLVKSFMWSSEMFQTGIRH